MALQTSIEHSDVSPQLAVGLKEAARLLSISRSLAYKLAASGEIPTISLGERRKIVPIAAIEKLLSKWDDQGSNQTI